MPHSFFLLDKGIFTSPGWEDVATHLPTLKKEDEKNFLGIMLEELNNTFALQLDLCPSMDKSGQWATDMHDQTDILNVVFAGGSHSSLVIDHFQSQSIKVLDATVPGFRLTDSLTQSMEGDSFFLNCLKV
jgi:hypothetical protein